MPHSYTEIKELEVVICNDCGAYAKSKEEIEHYLGCKAGDAKHWERYYKTEVKDKAKPNNQDKP